MSPAWKGFKQAASRRGLRTAIRGLEGRLPPLKRPRERRLPPLKRPRERRQPPFKRPRERRMPPRQGERPVMPKAAKGSDGGA
jgi:hypothetical protein